MSKTLRWVFVLLPCTPGLILLAAGLTVSAWQHDGDERGAQLCLAGGMVLVAGWVIGMLVAWRIAHPKPEPDEEEDRTPPTR